MTDEVVAAAAPQKITIQSLLKGLVKYRASDLHLKSGRPPLYRVNGNIIPTKMPDLSSEDVKELAYSTMTARQIEEFERSKQIDFGYSIPGMARFRANIFMQKGTISLVVRMVPLEIPHIDTLGLPPVVAELALKSRGLLLVTGATGSGKSTTMAALIDQINRNMRVHVITVEDPIEFVFEDKMSAISQREMGTDAPDMAKALRAAMRQDPDVITIGEMRDYETIHTALTAAETGHLVISTLHTNSASQSLDRILDSFPVDSKNQTRLMLSNSLLGIINQQLVKRADGKGRVLVCEVMVKSPSISKLILDNKFDEILPVIESSNVYYKMQSTNQALEKLVREGTITMDEAVLHSDRPEDLRLRMSGMVGGGHAGIDAGQIMEQTKRLDLNATDGIPEMESEKTSGVELDAVQSRENVVKSSGMKSPTVYSKASVVARKRSA